MNFYSLLKTLRWLIFLGLFVLSAVFILFAVLQTKWAKEEIKNYLVTTFCQEGIELNISDLDGKPPLSWTIQTAQIHLSPSEELDLNHITIRLKFLPLLKGKIAINYIHIETGKYTFLPISSVPKETSLKEAKALLRQSLENINLPCSISLNQIAVNHFSIENRDSLECITCGINGSLQIKKDKKAFQAALNLFSPDSYKTYLEASIEGSKKQNKIEATLHTHVDCIPLFLPFQGEILSSFNMEGPWSSWEAVLYDQPVTEGPLVVNAAGSCLHTEVKPIPALNADWKFNTAFLIPSSHQIDIQKLSLQNKQIKILVKGSVFPQLDQSDLKVAFSLNDLSPYAPISLAGSVEGKGFYQAGQFKMALKTKNLQIDNFQANTCIGTIQGNYKEKQLTADVALSSKDSPIPFENRFQLYCSAEKISASHIQLDMENDSLSGDIAYSIADNVYEGSLSASIEELNRFEALLKVQRLYGNLETKIILSSEEKEQQALCTLSGTHIRYQNMLIDELSLNCDLKKPLNCVQGELHLLAEKVYTEGLYFETIQIDTHSEPNFAWPFSVDLEGRIETPFNCSAKGIWQYRLDQFKLTLSELTGNLLDTSIHLEQPTSLFWKKEAFQLTALDLQVGLGHIHTALNFSANQAHSNLEIRHFPLHLFRCFKPHFGLKGFLSAKGFVEGSPNNLQGAFNAVLEEASIIHFGKKEEFHSKGSFQLHLSDHRLQAYADIKATDAQFLDLTASLPIHYTLYPFSISLNKEQSTSAELTAEGKLEDLFDFVNLGTNHFTGLVSCRLFLSQTLQHPSLLGTLELQNGTYDNYLTGISLKSIQAEFEAQNTLVRLNTLTATDDQSGAVFASGNIELNPQEHFPFHFDAELSNLHSLGFDMIDCHLSGPLYLTGTTKEMLAQGNLLIDKAKIQITERLPFEAPSLPFTYIHKPQHLDSIVTPSVSPFTFHLDLELTASDKVLVEGKGLNAELEGDIHVHGTNTRIAANGKLNLVKGEYIFSGKVFKLTEANVSFNDKPTPSTYLNVSGTLSMPDITITAMMRGPITSPQLTFQSNPHKSTSSILALILFNKDISEINHMEAVQLASTVISLSGGAGPDVLESIRKTIGVDRLNISSNPGSDEIAVQVGKYLTRGIMITLSQSATSSQVIVEVELPKGFVFQAETQEEEEGKFSLKWRKSY